LWRVFGTKAKSEGSVWSHQSIKQTTSHPQIARRCLLKLLDESNLPLPPPCISQGLIVWLCLIVVAGTRKTRNLTKFYKNVSGDLRLINYQQCNDCPKEEKSDFP